MLTCAITDVGIHRDNNEDNCAIASFRFEAKDQSSYYAFGLVCDGMGGAAAGEVASQIAVDTIVHDVVDFFQTHRDSPSDVGEIKSLLRDAVGRANTAVYDKAAANREMEGMGTTSVMALLRSGIVYVGNVGDSRGYVWSNGQLFKRTIDHSYVQELVTAGLITEEASRNHPRRNEITRALGIWEKIQVDVDAHVARSGDIYMLCSDGLWEMVDDSRIARVFSLPSPPEDPAARLKFWANILINEANDAGGVDNISVVLLQVEAADVVEGAEKLLEAPKPATRRYRPKPVVETETPLTKTLNYTQREDTNEHGERSLTMPAK
jgi:protein phosphatase